VADLEQLSGRPMDAGALNRIQFLVCVGAGDNRAADVPRQWDAFVGTTRVERAQRFTATLQAMGIPAQLAVVPGAGHEVAAGMMEHVTAFLTDVTRSAAASTPPLIDPADPRVERFERLIELGV
jgi:hypothetical protein